MQSCDTPLFLPGEEDPVPPHQWPGQQKSSWKTFMIFLVQAAFDSDVADSFKLEQSPLLYIK